MRRLDGFLVLGVPALLAMVALIVWKSHRANDVLPSASLALDDVPHVASRPADVRYRPITVADLRSRRDSFLPKTYYAYGEPLPAGYRCSGAGGMVYRTYEKNGSTVVDPLMAAGVQVRCGGDERSSYR